MYVEFKSDWILEGIQREKVQRATEIHRGIPAPIRRAGTGLDVNYGAISF